MRQVAWQCRIYYRTATSLAGGQTGCFHTNTTTSHLSLLCRSAPLWHNHSAQTTRLSNIRWYSEGRANASRTRELDRLEGWPTLPPGVHEKRERTIKKVNDCVKKHFGKHFFAKPFGSVCYGADAPDSDIDLVIMDPDRPQGWEPKHQGRKTPTIYSVKRLGKALSIEGFKVDLMLKDASVPIVKFRDRETGLNCDVNVNECLGYRNSLMTKQYCTILPILPALILYIKQWAKAQRWITSTNSYTLAIMTIGVLQHHGVLPKLQRELPERKRSRHDYFWARSRGGKRYLKCETIWNPPDEGWVPSRTMTLDEALVAWFRYWDHEHNYGETGIDTKRGGVFRRQRHYLWKEAGPAPAILDPEDQVILWMNEPEPEIDPSEFNQPLEVKDDDEPLAWTTQEFCVQDPFIRDKNLMSRMFNNQMEQWRDSCRKAYEALEHARADAPETTKGNSEELARYMADALLVS